MKQLTATWMLLAALSGAGCASLFASSVAPGTPAADVRARIGAPTDQRTLADGTKAWDYATGPQGFVTTRMVFDTNDRLVRTEQLLDERHFRALTPGTTKAEAQGLVGRPGEVSFFKNLNEEVWTYRFKDGTFEMLNDVHFGLTDGRLRYYSIYRDPAYSSAVSP